MVAAPQAIDVQSCILVVVASQSHLAVSKDMRHPSGSFTRFSAGFYAEGGVRACRIRVVVDVEIRFA